MARFNKNVLLDKIQRGFVLTCAGITVLGTLQLFTHFGTFFVVTKPQHEEQKRIEMEQLLKEGREIVDEMKDKAPSISS